MCVCERERCDVHVTNCEQVQLLKNKGVGDETEWCGRQKDYSNSTGKSIINQCNKMGAD